MTYDTKCLELAQAFLRKEDHADHSVDLAKAIQAAIEDYLTDNELDSQ